MNISQIESSSPSLFAWGFYLFALLSVCTNSGECHTQPSQQQQQQQQPTNIIFPLALDTELEWGENMLRAEVPFSPNILRY